MSTSSAIVNSIESGEKLFLPTKTKDVLYRTPIEDYKDALKMTKEQYADYDLELPQNKEIKDTIESLESIVKLLEGYDKELAEIKEALQKNPQDTESQKKFFKIQDKIQQYCLLSNNSKILENILPNIIKSIVNHIMPSGYLKHATSSALAITFNKEICHKIIQTAKSGYKTLTNLLPKKNDGSKIDLNDKGEQLVSNLMISQTRSLKLSK